MVSNGSRPLVAVDAGSPEQDGLFLDMTGGRACLFGGEEALLREILRRG